MSPIDPIVSVMWIASEEQSNELERIVSVQLKALVACRQRDTPCHSICSRGPTQELRARLPPSARSFIENLYLQKTHG